MKWSGFPDRLKVRKRAGIKCKYPITTRIPQLSCLQLATNVHVWGEKKRSNFLQKRFFLSLRYSIPTLFSFAHFSTCELLLPSLWRTNSPHKPISFPPANSDLLKSSTSNYIILKMLWKLRISFMIYTTKSLFLKE